MNIFNKKRKILVRIPNPKKTITINILLECFALNQITERISVF